MNFKIEINPTPEIFDKPMYPWFVLSNNSVIGYGRAESISEAAIEAEKFLKNYKPSNTLVIPVPIGTTTYVICNDNVVRPFVIESYGIADNDFNFCGIVKWEDRGFEQVEYYSVDFFGKLVFLTTEEAELMAKKG